MRFAGVDSNAARRQIFLIALGLAAVTLIAYARIVSLGFLGSYDDALYVTANPVVQRGLTWDGLLWALTTRHAANWHPLTWLSHMLDVTLFGLEPAAHHAVNLAIHLANVLLIFLLLGRATGRVGPAAAVAALWAVHPLHVESVAWISERKDVLCAFFWLLTLAAYAAYAARENHTRKLPGARIAYYLLALCSAACALMAKPMAVTLPCVLLLLDLWPLKRIHAGPRAKRDAARLAIEKFPFAALAIASSAATLIAQGTSGAVQEIATLPMRYRLANAALAYVQYLGKTYLPIDLAAIYPHPGAGVNIPLAASAALFLVLTTITFIALARPMPYLIVGWLWFLGTLVPVIGIVQVGSQAMADRYTYIPHIGLFIAIVWTAAALLGRRTRIGAFIAFIGTALLAAITFHQTAYWIDAATLFRHTIAVTGPNPLAHINLGTAMLDAGDNVTALAQFDKAAQFDSDLAMAQYNRGVALQRLGQFGAARDAFERAVALDPRDADSYNNLGLVLIALNEFEQAEGAFKTADVLAPDKPDAQLNRAALHSRQGDDDAAEEIYVELLRRHAGDPNVLVNLANLYARTGRGDDALRLYARAIEFDPENHLAHYNLAILLHERGDDTAAQHHLNEARRLNP